MRWHHVLKKCRPGFHHVLWGVLAVAVLSSGAPVLAGLVITPTFDSSITGDPNAAVIEGTINSAISVYESLYTNPINVQIYFTEMNGGLGQSEKVLYDLGYSNFRAGLAANQAISHQSDQLTALNNLPNTTNNPVNNTPDLAAPTALIKALGFGGLLPPNAGLNAMGNGPGPYDGIIGLNTGITFPPHGQSGNYSLLAVTEHEINEVLGSGSSLNQSFQALPSAEDLYRYASAGVRSYTTNSSAKAFFSYDGGNTLLAQFDNQNDGGDWSDWQSNPLPPGVSPQVQDAFGTPGATPTEGPNEIAMLDVIGYTQQQQAVPEPSSIALATMSVLILTACACRHRKPRTGNTVV